MKKDIEILISPGLWSKNQKMIVFTIFTIVLIIMGFVAGSYITIKAVALVASGFIDPFLVERAVWMFENDVRDCFPSKLPNALNDSNQGE